MYTTTGTASALKKRNEILKKNSKIEKIDGIIVGDYGTFIPKSILIEYRNIFKNLNKCNIDEINEYMKIITDLTIKRVKADIANKNIIAYKKNNNILI